MDYYEDERRCGVQDQTGKDVRASVSSRTGAHSLETKGLSNSGA